MNKFVFDETFVKALLKDGCPAKVFRLLKEQSASHPHPKLSFMLETSFHDEMYNVYYLHENFDLMWDNVDSGFVSKIQEINNNPLNSLSKEFCESYKKYRTNKF